MKKQISFLLAALCLLSCNKIDTWLDVKQNKNELVPVSISDYQALLDNPSMYQNFSSLGQVGTDNFYVTDADFNSSTEIERNTYLWQDEIYKGVTSVLDWTYSYRRISYANIVLDGLQKLSVKDAEQPQKNNVLGQALFYRAIALFDLLQLFAPQYDPASASADLGVPILISSDINTKASRASVADCYAQVIADIKQAIELLPLRQAYLSRPCGLAANALLAKIYLQMGNYSQALSYSSMVLEQKNDLYDFKTITSVNSRQFPVITAEPKEVIFYAEASDYAMITTAFMGRVDSLLFKSYASGDLRKDLLYRTYTDGRRMFKGTYTGTFSLFGGIGVNEVMLIKAEAAIRTGDVSKGISTINQLLKYRFSSGSFVPYNTEDEQAAMRILIAERRKELPFTGQLRWMDIRRLNKETGYAITQYRLVNGQDYQIPPNDPRYVFPIPPDELLYNNLPQTER